MSRCWTQAGLWVGRPLEAHPKKGVYVSSSDLLNPDVIGYLVAEICEGRYWYLHFGTPCKTWGPAARRSGCTRTRLAPGEDGSLTREIKANEEARVVAMLCALLAKHGGFFSIENPAGSYLFLYEPIAALSRDFECYVASFPQCAYGLQLPGAPPDTFCRKNTYLLTNMNTLRQLSVKCPGLSETHHHETAWGSRIVNGERIQLTSAAGQYPLNLCNRWAQITSKFFQDLSTT